MLDERKLKVTIELDAGTAQSSTHTFENLAIEAIGSKHASMIQNNCEVRICNVDKDVREKLLTDGTPFGALCPRNTILIEAGRESYDLTEVYKGDITTVNVGQAPDIWLTINALTGQHFKRTTTSFSSREPTTKFKAIAQRAADAFGLSLDFKAVDKSVSNFNFSGSVNQLIAILNTVTMGVDAFIDDDILIVRPRDDPQPRVTTEVSLETGMIGIPEFIDFGIRVSVLMDPEINLGDDITIVSEANPTTDGDYNIYKYDFNLTNRDTPFYYTLDTARFVNMGCD